MNLLRRLLELLFGREPEPEPEPGPPPPQGQPAADCMVAVNRLREERGLVELAYDGCLANQAQAHAEDMLRRQRLDHQGFSGRLAECLKGAGSENVAQGYPSGEDVVLGWFNSSGHRQNMLKSSYNVAGVGYANDDGRHWWCMLYAVAKTD